MPDDAASLDQLHDVVTPAAVSWWPPAPGWWVLGGILLTLTAWSAWRWWRHWRNQAYRRAALAELRDWEATQNGDAALGAEDVRRLAALLRRTALAALPREQLAGLPQSAWTAFLNDTLPESGRVSWEWLAAAYRPGVSLNVERSREAASAVRHWLRHHRFETIDCPQC